MATRSVLPSLVSRPELPLTSPPSTTRSRQDYELEYDDDDDEQDGSDAEADADAENMYYRAKGASARSPRLLPDADASLSLFRRPLAQVSSRMSRKRHSSLYGRSSMQRRRRATGPSASSLARRGNKRMLDVHGGADNAPSRPGSSFPRVHLVRGFKALKQTTKLLFCTLGRPEEALKSYEELLGYTKSAVTRNCPSPFLLHRLDLALSPV
jgi:hypothetical protein